MSEFVSAPNFNVHLSTEDVEFLFLVLLVIFFARRGIYIDEDSLFL